MNIEMLKSLSVLYVEDEDRLREDVKENISPFVKSITTASDGKEGLEIFLTNHKKIDLVISDILMPHINGIDMVKGIREIDQEIPVIFTTAFDSSKYILQTIELGVSSYILKPIDIEKLLLAIQKATIQIENIRLKDHLKHINADLQKQVEEKTKKLREQNEQLQKQLYTDELTGLPNRKALNKHLTTLTHPVVVLLDINSFNHINDIYGDIVGDMVLKKLSERLLSLGGWDIFRVGGDQFALVSDRVVEHDIFGDIVDDIVKKSIYKSIELEEYDISFKIALTFGISDTTYNVLQNADLALKKAKTFGSRYEIFDENDKFYLSYKEDVKWSNILKNAIKDDHIKPYYQPIVDRDGEVVKYEALIRIVDDSGKVYSPIQFLSISKKIKLYSKIEESLIKQVIKDIKRYNLYTNINVSIEDIVNEDFISFLNEILLDSDVARYITFEFLESESIKEYESVYNFIKTVKGFGSKIAIDDFGSGYSNFAYMLKIKPEFIKIDGSLIKNIDKDKNSYIIVYTIKDFANRLGIKTVAEFVHSKEVFDILKSMGIDYFQGYYFGEPKPTLG